MPTDGPRINVIGTSGAGKTTLAARLGDRLGVPHIELDALNWGQNWTERPDADFRRDLADFMAQDAWVLCGNYSRVRPMLLERANTFVWLDYPRWRVTWRVLCRSVERAWTKRELWAGNRESFRLTFFSRDSIIWWSLKTFGPNRKKYRAFFEELGPRQEVQTVRLRSPREAERWLAGMVEG